MKRILLASTSTVYGGTYLSYLQDELIDFFTGIDEILFVPYARPSGITHDEYTQIAQQFFNRVGKRIVGLHTFADPKKAIRQAKAIFTGGGNTFVLVNQLYGLEVMDVLREAVENGTLYMGTSAGSNIAGQTMQTTNDMPIVYPPSFKTLGLVPFNINPHYLDPDPQSKHKGETRETRIKEFHVFNDTPVIGLREGSWLRVEDEKVSLKGDLTARIFLKGQEPYESTEILL
ncbi:MULTISPECIES: dipeptidase PepE [Capnocytophaga]|jgi:dipeptidase E|uniref:Peptidase E n=1 Tax=Capnocytophaga ochracea TaxID=1018 RepID=A0A2X2SPW4_CAPOC|nr:MULTISPECIES: dipeptidase PepE [Capnocytophaga]AVM54251.1 dipeptidase PepE [Capnocytophaga sp. oral taxon 864]EJF35929.1 putative Asp-specific dipeptidase [Capnocytophaga sp. oral taxon 335 str. F0486]EKY14633.1 dipeptidase E [Capnocytophaga sp. oral taxon 324 str. F0483]SQA93884.1 Peptidase E [Capnocytophaga ochracea]